MERFMGSRPSLMIADPELIKTMNIKDFHVFVNRNDFTFGDPLQDRSLFNLIGDEWKTMRSIISPTFSSGKMRSMHPIIIDCVHKLVDNLRPKAMSGEDVEMKKTMGNLTMDVIASCAFGTKIDVYNDQKTNEFIVNARKVFRGNVWRIWVFSILLSISQKLIHWTGFQFTDPSAQQFFGQAVKSILARRKSAKVQQKDYLQLMINALNRKNVDNDKEPEVDDLNEDIYGKTQLIESNSNSKPGNGITDVDILATSFAFFVAGYETTGALLSLVLYNLALNEKCQQKLYEEVNGLDGKYDYESVSKMPYLEACIAETLRLYPPIAALNRYAL
ncbi:unnamed protein product, partial [Oppiella nova]